MIRARRNIAADDSGFGLPVILLLLTLIVTLSLVAAGQIAQWHEEVEHGLSSTRASYAADAGLARVLLELSKDPNYSPGTLVLPDGDPEGLEFTDRNLGAEIEVINNFSGLSPVPTPDGDLAPGRVWLRSRGKIGEKFFRSQKTSAKAIVTRPDVIMNYGLRQLSGQIKFGANNSIQSYVPAGLVDPKPPGGFGANVKVRANEQGLFLPGSSAIKGSVDIPTADTPVTGTPLGGTQVVQDSPPLLKFVEPAAFRSLPHPNITGANIDLPPNQPYTEVLVTAGGTLVLHGGEYYMEGLRLGVGVDVLVTGATLSNPCVVYIGSGFQADGNNKINWDGAPRLLQLYDTDIEGDGINNNWVQAGARMSCVWASRETGVNFETDVQFYGAIDAKQIKFKDDCLIVFDESLTAEVLQGKPEWILTKKER